MWEGEGEARSPCVPPLLPPGSATGMQICLDTAQVLYIMLCLPLSGEMVSTGQVGGAAVKQPVAISEVGILTL